MRAFTRLSRLWCWHGNRCPKIGWLFRLWQKNERVLICRQKRDAILTICTHWISAVRSEQDFARDWFSYRKTLAVEQSAWFLEPTVHSQRSASEFFSFESLCAAHLNVRFYRQLPAFMTGMGLMFTFLAILIGLSKLHANGSEIDGIQGLINGLSGKFVTSIVGLACANAFTLLEHSFWHRLDNRHRECISLLDEMFPQRATDQHSQGSPSPNGSPAAIATPIRNETAHQLVEVVQQRLGSTVAALNSAAQALTALQSKHAPMKLDDLPRRDRARGSAGVTTDDESHTGSHSRPQPLD